MLSLNWSVSKNISTYANIEFALNQKDKLQQSQQNFLKENKEVFSWIPELLGGD